MNKEGLSISIARRFFWLRVGGSICPQEEGLYWGGHLGDPEILFGIQKLNQLNCYLEIRFLL